MFSVSWTCAITSGADAVAATITLARGIAGLAATLAAGIRAGTFAVAAASPLPRRSASAEASSVFSRSSCAFRKLTMTPCSSRRSYIISAEAGAAWAAGSVTRPRP